MKCGYNNLILYLHFFFFQLATCIESTISEWSKTQDKNELQVYNICYIILVINAALCKTETLKLNVITEY